VSVVVAAWLLAAGGLAQATPPAPPASFPVEEIAPGHWVHYGSMDERSVDNLGDQANVGFVVGEKCVAVIDAGGSLPVGQALLAAVRAKTSLPICWVVITHFHPDHFFGAAAFVAPGTQFVAHDHLPRALSLRQRPYLSSLQRDLGAAADGSVVVAPTLLVEGERTLDLGGRTLLLKAWPTAHTDQDLTVFDPSTGTLWLGDLLFLQHTPVIDGLATGFVQVMDALAKIPARRFVAGHGRTDKPWPEALADQRAYLDLVIRETRQAIKRKRTIEQAVESVGQSEAGKWLQFENFHRRNVTAAYTELEWED
jgi:quinoprotein relay system zinc metallohydrolase 2